MKLEISVNFLVQFWLHSTCCSAYIMFIPQTLFYICTVYMITCKYICWFKLVWINYISKKIQFRLDGEKAKKKKKVLHQKHLDFYFSCKVPSYAIWIVTRLHLLDYSWEKWKLGWCCKTIGCYIQVTYLYVADII